jgi:hypothetical protein
MSSQKPPITDQNLRRIADITQRAPNLVKINFFNNVITGEGAEYFLRNARLVGVVYLNFCFNDIGDRGGSALSGRTTPHLKELHINKTGITEQTIHAIRGNGALEQLEHLDIGYQESYDRERIARVGDEGIMQPLLRALGTVRFIYLEVLNVENNNIDAVKARFITGFQMPNLKSFNINRNPIKDEGLEIIVRGVRWINLTSLNIKDTDITNRAGSILFLYKSNIPNATPIVDDKDFLLQRPMDRQIQVSYDVRRVER